MSYKGTTFWFPLNFLEFVSFCFILSKIVGLLGWLQSMIELSRTQDEEVGDGTTSVIILGMLFVHLFINFIYACVYFMCDLYFIIDYRVIFNWAYISLLSMNHGIIL